MRPVAALLGAVLAVALAACGGSGDRQHGTSAAGSPAPSRPRTEGPPVDYPVPDALLSVSAQALPAPDGEQASRGSCRPGAVLSMRTRRLAYAAVAKGDTPVLAHPAGTRTRLFHRRNLNRYPTVFGVLSEIVDAACNPTWLRVQLPVRPNGSTGWVDADDVELTQVHTRIEIDLSARRLVLFRDGKRVLGTQAAVGASITPTPTGSFYVNQRLVAPDPWGPFGPAALGISAFSPVLQDWAQGGPIAVHGTNDPASIGRAVSHGCVRVPNETLELLFRSTPAGTPVEIRA